MEQKSSALRAKEAFLSLYHAGEFAPGSRIPSETAMAGRLGVSRETWRKALVLLRNDGLLVSKHGSGTYLLERPRRIVNDLAQLQSMSKMIAAAGIEEKESHVVGSVGRAPAEAARFFEASPEEEFFILERIRHADCGIISASIGYLPQKYTQELMERMPPSLFTYLEETHGIRISRALTELFIPASDDPLRVKLQLPAGRDAFGFRQYYYDSRGNPLLYSLDYLRSDLFHFTIMRTRP
nr:GntR family transcriptional regulator [uncultured Agathobaculum sp.]